MAKKLSKESSNEFNKESYKESDKESFDEFLHDQQQPPLIPPLPKRQLGTCGSTNMNAINACKDAI